MLHSVLPLQSTSSIDNIIQSHPDAGATV